MDDISAAISQVLSDPEKMRQVQSLAASLGLNGDNQNGSPPAQNAGVQNPTTGAGSAPSPGGGIDLSALGGLLNNLGIGGTPVGSAPSNTMPADLLSGLMGGGGTPAPSSNSFDVGGLAGLLRSGASASSGPSARSSGGFDMGVLMKLQQAMANVATNRSNIELLMALKPRLSEERAKKVDDAIRVMQIVQFLPLLKETGLFGQMDGVLGSLGSLTGLGGGHSSNTGGLLGNLGGGLNSLLGGLMGRR